MSASAQASSVESEAARQQSHGQETLEGKTDTAFHELSIPLATLKLAPQPGMSLRGDLGILRGDGTRTMQRVYWSNKATAITADVPSEAELTPKLWGTLRFRQQP